MSPDGPVRFGYAAVPGIGGTLTQPNDFHTVKQALEQAGLKPELAEVTMKPTTESIMAGEDAARMQKLLDALESLDDVQEVYTTAVLEE